MVSKSLVINTPCYTRMLTEGNLTPRLDTLTTLLKLFTLPIQHKPKLHWTLYFLPPSVCLPQLLRYLLQALYPNSKTLVSLSLWTCDLR